MRNEKKNSYIKYYVEINLNNNIVGIKFYNEKSIFYSIYFQQNGFVWNWNIERFCFILHSLIFSFHINII